MIKYLLHMTSISLIALAATRGARHPGCLERRDRTRYRRRDDYGE